jgi:uncharacterized protein (DUF305 family)
MQAHETHMAKGSYKHLLIETGIDFLIMYFVMYTMIATLDHLYLNINNTYMTLMMVAPMMVVMLLSMRSMFPSRLLNTVIFAGAAAVFIGSFAATRTQAGVGNVQFLKSMIPHHSGAILMCEQASLTDPEIIALCKSILKSQKDEIAQMQKILERY